MNHLDYVTLRERASEFEASVHNTPDVSVFCSCLHWQMAAHESLHQARDENPPLIVEENGNWLVFVEQNRGVFYPLEAAWTFGCPIIGDPTEGVNLLQKVASRFPQPVGFVITGIKRDQLLHQELRALEPETLQFDEFETTECMIIDLEGGVDSWLERRSKKFRRTIRNLELPDGIEIVSAEKERPELLFQRILDVQRLTYKWQTGTDIFQGEEYVRFYSDLMNRLHASGDLRIQFAQKDGNDVGYIFGGVSEKMYRGLQMSYVEEMRPFGLGNLLQLDNLRRMEAEGIKRYDLGMHALYKERWADSWDNYLGIFVVLA